ncbi:DNA-methyltransferase [Promicromonospora sp. NPDC057138]|uniref:DNA-methyltransferase n=1 Tax=Promicromonospora sp. NPDC057138 TaxID=3346031 RepID=UPI003636CC3E
MIGAPPWSVVSMANMRTTHEFDSSAALHLGVDSSRAVVGNAVTRPYYTDDAVTLYHGDCLKVLREIPDASIDAVVTDPPYGLGFMGKEWDSGKSFVERKADKRNTFDHVGGNHNPASSADQQRTRLRENTAYEDWCTAWATQCLRVLKPGGHLVAAGGARTWHRLAAAVEDAGFEIRDSIAWLHGQGFPKSLDVAKAVTRLLEDFGDVTGDTAVAVEQGSEPPAARSRKADTLERRTGLEAAQRWEGWGTALKPGFEPIVVARKALAGTVAANVLGHGTGALHIDACRVGDGSDSQGDRSPHEVSAAVRYTERGAVTFAAKPGPRGGAPSGRWPANVVLDGAQAAELDRQSGNLTSGANPIRRGSDKFRDTYGDFKGQEVCTPARGADSGGASRFFPIFRYEAKAPASERPRAGDIAHPTVKPLGLMRWLVRLVTPPAGLVLDPFAGSGTTAEACVIEGVRCIVIEREADYLPLITARLTKPLQPGLDLGTAGT